MFNTSISNNQIITINRGDNFNMLIPINGRKDIEIVDYIMTEYDHVYFAICEPHQDFEYGVVRKILTVDNLDADGNIEISLIHADTYYLLPGTYYYEIKLKIGEDEAAIVKTILPRRKLVIC